MNLSESLPSLTFEAAPPSDPNSLSHTISLTSGYISLSFWLFAQIPQVIENYKNQSVDGIAFGFLASWVAGDVSNLIGCILTNALPFQVLLSSYYCCIDLILCSQYLYYTKIYPKIKHHRYFSTQRLQKLTSDDLQEQPSSPEAEFPSEHILSPPTFSQPIAIGGGKPAPKMNFVNNVLNNVNNNNHNQSKGGSSFTSLLPTGNSFSNMVTGSFLASFGKVRGAPIGITNINNHNTISTMDSMFTVLGENSELIGKIFAWFCTSLYLSARIPQLVKNYHRKSTEGLSILLFFCALNGNIFYTLSILTSDDFAQAPNSEVRWDFFIRELPYILGSAGTIAFDLLALYQWKIYRDNASRYQPLSSNDIQHHHHPHQHNEDTTTTDIGLGLSSSAEEYETKASHSTNIPVTQPSESENMPFSHTMNGFLGTHNNKSTSSLTNFHTDRGGAGAGQIFDQQEPEQTKLLFSSLKELLGDPNERSRLSFDSTKRSYGSIFDAPAPPVTHASSSTTIPPSSRGANGRANSSVMNTPLTPWDLLDLPTDPSDNTDEEVEGYSKDPMYSLGEEPTQNVPRQFNDIPSFNANNKNHNNPKPTQYGVIVD
ncbi:hypothetical protein DASC09_053260 [Saccharomycopsis crataegensis]|uniref:Uncharacterized protein n=1 Tax=Saccharomycopsis crataegensis TaxID=43959 RepID=A0AAV5QU11_9ASCO|nr:hypothetical protein DASC09_053260 [Saccharomycopsis crataegensis]